MARAHARSVRGMIVQKPFAPTCAQAGAIDLMDCGLIGAPAWARTAFRTGFDVCHTQPCFLTEAQRCVTDLGVHMRNLGRRIMGEAAHPSAQSQRGNPPVADEEPVLQIAGATGKITANPCGGPDIIAIGVMRRQPNPVRPAPSLPEVS